MPIRYSATPTSTTRTTINAIAAYSKYLTLSTDTKPDPLIYDNRGLANFSAKHYEAAIADFNKFIALDPKDAAETPLFLGDAYAALKQYPAAIKAYSAYITSHPNDATGSALSSRGLAEYQAGMYKEAVADFKAFLVLHPNDKAANTNLIAAQTKAGGVSIPDLVMAVKNDPTNVAIRVQLAKALFEAKRFPEAIEQYNAILAAQPTDYVDLSNRGLAYSNAGDHAKAMADFVAYTTAKPGEAVGWEYLGIEYGQASNWKGAVEAFTKYINLAPPTDKDVIDAYKSRGIAEYNLQDWKAAAADLRKYDAAKPNDEQVSKLLPTATLNSGDASTAIATLVARVKLHPEDRTAWYNLGVAYVSLNQFQNAIEPFNKAIALKADEVAYFNLGFAYYKLGETTPGNYAKAALNAGKALQLKPGYAEAQLLLADSEYFQKDYKDASTDYNKYQQLPGIAAADKTYAEQQGLRSAINSGNYAAVIDSAKKAIAATPNEPSNYKILGQAEVASKDFEAAIPVLTKYLGMKADDADASFALGVAYYNTKQMDKAADAYEKALSLKPDNYEAANSGALAYKSIGDASQADPTKAGPAYDKAVALFEKAVTIKGPGKASADALFNEAQTYEAKAKVTDTTDPLKLAVPVWERWIIAAPTDPDLAKVKQHVADLKAQIANG